jgi:hypothetical protein
MKHGSDFMQQLGGPGLFVAAGLQPGSHTAKALCSLSFTLLKMSSRPRLWMRGRLRGLGAWGLRGSMV